MGRSKARLRFGEQALLARIAGLLQPVVDSTLIVAAPNQLLPTLPPEVRVVHDREHACGPLNGFSTGLHALPPSAEVVFLSSCDAPLLKPLFVRRVIDLLGTHDIAIPVKDGFPQPLAAAYRVAGLLTRVERLLASGHRRLIDLLPGADVRYLQPEEFRDVDPNLDSLRNVNTPEEYESLLREFGEGEVTS